MYSQIQVLKRVAVIICALALTACASYSGRGLVPGVATRPEITAVMGEPAMAWQDADGREQLAYPRGPEGTQTFMVFIAADGRLERIEGVLDEKHFARIENGRTDKDAVLRLLGPPNPRWTIYFKARDELALEWRYCSAWSEVSRFDVLIDATTNIVRSTFRRPDLDGWRDDPITCGH